MSSINMNSIGVEQADRRLSNDILKSKFQDFQLKYLLEAGCIDWNEIEETFERHNYLFEKALCSIHFKRKKLLTDSHRERIIKFLYYGYTVTNDIRYFNEFLWFYKEGADVELKNKCFEKFEANLNEFNQHSVSVKDTAVKNKLKEISFSVSSDNDRCVDITQKVGLIGFPFFFPKIIKELQKSGFQIDQFFLPYHSKKIIKRLFSNAVAVKVIALMCGNRLAYKTLNSDYKAVETEALLAERRMDIGFHKLNFIIKKNIFGVFSKGLINDHWGMLPFLRGKSTIAYSVLLGLPIGATMHLIEEGIDTGKIIGFYKCDITGIKTLGGVKNRFRRTMSERVISAIKLLSSSQFTLLDNNSLEGATYYEMHPWLVKFIENNILNRNTN